MVWYNDIVFKVLLFYVYDVKVISIGKKKENIIIDLVILKKLF